MSDIDRSEFEALSSDLTYRYPRTLDAAFGLDAHSANPIEGPGNALPHADRPVLITCALAVVFLMVGAARGWF